MSTQWSYQACLLVEKGARGPSLGAPASGRSSHFGPSPTPPPRGHSVPKVSNEASRRPRPKKRGSCSMQGERGEEEANTSASTYFSPSDTLRAGFLAARGVLSRWYSSLPVRDSASCAASLVFFAAISASMPASVARSWSRYDFSATISWTRLSRRCARNALTVFCLCGHATRRRRHGLWDAGVAQAPDRVLLLRQIRAHARDHLLRALDGFDGVGPASEPAHAGAPR